MGTDTRRGLHIGVLVGVSTAAYAAALAGVTTLQAATDRAMIAASARVGRAVDAVSADHDVLEHRLGNATDRYARIAAAYSDLGPAIDDLESSLDDLTALSGRLGTSAAQLPRRVTLPAVRTAPARVNPPRTHAVTRASGG